VKPRLCSVCERALLGHFPARRHKDAVMLMSRAIGILVGALLFVFASPAQSAITQCSVVTSGIQFSPYDTVTKAQVDAIGIIEVTCTGTESHSFSLEASGGNTNSCDTRQMSSGVSTLNYQVYRNSGRTARWCADTGGFAYAFKIDFKKDGATQTLTFTVFGRIFSGQNPSGTGNFSDVLTVTLQEQKGAVVTTTTFPVSTIIGGTCSVSGSSLAFGSYLPNQNLDSSVGITVNCTSGTNYQVSLGTGNNMAGSTRRMSSAQNFLNYLLFQDSARTIAWGDGSALGSKRSGTGNGSNQALPVFGRVPSGQNARIGSYTDVLVITVEY
jgi:spore coat protein U-like protein